MKVIELEQNTDAWLKFREDKIGASDANVIMGVNPWETPYKLWQRKNKLIPEQEENSAMRRGKNLESEALRLFNESFGYNLKPTVGVHDVVSYLMASFDGYDGKVFCEIKCPNEIDHQLACNGIVPEKYLPQICKQFIVSDCDRMFYVSYKPGNYYKELAVVEVQGSFFTKEYIDDLLSKVAEFHRCVVEFDPPELCDRDFNHSDDEYLKDLINHWKAAQNLRKEFEEKEEKYRKEIIKRCNDQSTICNGAKITKFVRAGNVNYSIIPELKGVDLSQYRKNPTTQWRLSYVDSA